MSEFDPNVTVALKRASPFWSSVRDNLTIKVAAGLLISILGTAVTAIVQFSRLRDDVTQLKIEFGASKSQGEELATLRQHLADIDERVREQASRWERVDENLDRPIRRRR